MRDSCEAQKTIQKDIQKREAACFALQTSIKGSQVRLLVAPLISLWVSNITRKHSCVNLCIPVAPRPPSLGRGALKETPVSRACCKV